MKSYDDDRLYLEAALTLAEQAGALLREGALSTQPAESKSTASDLVTKYDRAAEELIVSGLQARFPRHRILGEEGGDRGGEAGQPRWIVDPLDGTTNFAHGLPMFTVSIGCEVDGELAVGVVLAPAMGLTFAARRGQGTTRNGQAVRVSQVATLDRALLVTGFPYDRHTAVENNFAQFVALKKRAQGIRRTGSAALDLALVASGGFDGYWEMKLKPWDIAAGILLVQEAGGVVTSWRGERVSLQQGEVLASNGLVHEQVRQVLGQTQHNVFA